MDMQIKINNLHAPTIDSTPKLSLVYPAGEFSAQARCTITVKSAASTVFEKIVAGENRVLIPLEFDAEPCAKYTVKAVSETENGKIYEAYSSFCTGKLGTEWRGRWITAADCLRRDEILSAVYLRREFSLRSKPVRAVLYISGLGYFEARINGEKVGDDLLSTPYTAYDKHILYRVFDVTEMLSGGANALGVILGNGFFNCFTDDPWQTSVAPWRDVPKMICELHIDYGDESEIIKSDRTWTSVHGPITFNGIRHGEEYDARLEKDGWDMPGYTGETFPCRTPKAPGAIMLATEVEPIRVRKTLRPVSRRKVKNGWLYELDRDIAGICSITFSGKAGERIQMRYCDYLDENGELDQTPLSCFVRNYKFQTDVYVKKSDEKETWHPIFTYHGFQYIEITGCAVPPELEDIEAWAICNDFENKGEFLCSDETVNVIQSMCRRSTQACCVYTLSSDAVREKNSWTGDTGLSCEQLLMNFGAEQLMAKWQMDLRDAMRTAGGLPCIIPTTGWGFNSINGPDWSHPVYEVPWQLYMSTGDASYLSDNIETLRLHCDYVASMAEDDGTVNYGLGDWCAPFEGPAISKNMESFKCPITVTDTAFYYSALTHLVKFAEILGRTDIISKYKPRAESTRRAFRENLFDKSTFTVYGDCQTATGVMAYHGLCDEDELIPLANKLLEQIHRDGDCLDFGVLGAKAVLDLLGRTGHSDVALKILTKPEYPSVKHWIDMGATAMWECWNGLGSHNQHMFCSISGFFYRYIGGISYAAPSGKTLLFTPGIDSGLESAHASVITPWGKAECSFENQNDCTKIHLIVPSSCTAKLILPNGEKTLSSGKYTFLEFKE